jgi:hypothetical protein
MAMKQILILVLLPLALAAVTHDVSEWNKMFEKFEKDFGKVYKTKEERSLRFINFIHNVQEMERHNQVKILSFKMFNGFLALAFQNSFREKTMLTIQMDLFICGLFIFDFAHVRLKIF